jgi:integrase
VRVAAYTGLRAGELAGLRVGRVDLLRGRLHVIEALKDQAGTLSTGPTKTHQRRSVPLPGLLVDMLAEHLAGRAGDPDAFVFVGAKGAPLRHNNFRRRVFAPAAAACAARDTAFPAGLRPHDLRHTCAALLIAEGGHPKAVAERLGHRSAKVTLDTYSHVFPSLHDQLTEGLDNRLREVRSLRTATREPVLLALPGGHGAT